MRRLLGLVVLVFLVAPLTFDRPWRSIVAPTVPAYAQAPAVLATTLDNGLRVLLLEDHRSPIVTFQTWYRVGSRTESRGHTGTAHFLEHLIFKGTPTHPGGQSARLV